MRHETIAQWQSLLNGFDVTHHQLGNCIVDEKQNTAHVFCYVTATHWIHSENEKLWTVVGSYDFDLTRQDSRWLVTSMVFHCKYQDGNLTLPDVAMKRVREQAGLK